MEQTIRSYAETEQGIESSDELEPVFNEREQVLEAFASTPMAYTVNGTTYKANGSYEAVMLCEFLQNEKLPAAFFAIKFQQAADLFTTLNEDELKPVDEAVSEETGTPEKLSQTVESVEGGEAPVVMDASSAIEDSDTGRDAVESSPETSTKSPTAEIVPIVEVPSASDATAEESSSSDGIVISTEPVNEKVADVEQLIIPETGSEPTEQVPAQSSDEVSHDEVVLEDISFADETIENNQPVVQTLDISKEALKNDDDELSADEGASNQDLLAEERAALSDDALQPQLDIAPETEIRMEAETESIDLPDQADDNPDILEYDGIDSPLLEVLPAAVEQEEYPEERGDEITTEEFSLPNIDENTINDDDRFDDIDPLQQDTLIAIDELLTELSYSVEAGDDEQQTQALEIVSEPARIEQLFKCLEAQIQAVSELDDIDTVRPIQDTLVEILSEADVEDPEHIARLYLQTYGVNQLADIIQLPVLAKATRSNHLIEKYRKIARFATRLIIQHEDTLVQGNHSLTNAA